MKILISTITALNLLLSNGSVAQSNVNRSPRIIDAFILAYDAMIKGNNEPILDYLILDMESVYFADTTPVERERAIQYFQKYNKPVLNASLFKLQQIGLADEMGNLKIKGTLLMMTSVQSGEKQGLIVEGYKYYGPVGAARFKITLDVINDKWQVIKVDLLSIS
ncbi:hypothetical protein [Clostridium intestinale]|uniref:Nuclear transport factor 2 family protein n=1 Tax=Clostridium intestinale TaxID=36845 RepID=A0A7D6ZZT5_9CLOT|nr:hypothetical protein [Clostridium intestinale]QLY81422.1 hypothetical protein HZF06_07520 [Clostridium intestinale]